MPQYRRAAKNHLTRPFEEIRGATIRGIRGSGFVFFLQALAAIRRRQRGTDSHVPIIALTGHDFADIGENYRESGFDAHIEKPYRTTEMFETIKRVLASRRAR